MIYPRVIPPVGKPTRWTNRLEFIDKEVLKYAKTHKHAWPFIKPVDAIKLAIPVCRLTIPCNAEFISHNYNISILN